MEKTVTISSWKFAYEKNSTVNKKNYFFTSLADIKQSGLKLYKATVPGNLELDMAKLGKLPEDIYFGTNIIEAQKLECVHTWNVSEFEIENTEDEKVLRFEGIDTFAEIFIDGEYAGSTDNMLISHEFSIDYAEKGRHELLVHILPTEIVAREIPISSRNRAMRYNMTSISVRKAPYMYGWDIMPRTVSSGIWKPVSVVYKKRTRLEETYLRTVQLQDNYCELELEYSIMSDLDDIKELRIEVTGICDDHKFECSSKIVSAFGRLRISSDRCKLWWPKNYGDPNLYEFTVKLLHGENAVDEKKFSFGIRTVELERTSLAGKDGKFCFKVNGQKIFVLGTNWVPTDAFPSRHDEFTLRGLELTNELNCNMIRCWGGNVYPSEMLYDYCDRHGIMVWQDFAMACGIYPNTDEFMAAIKFEATQVVKRLRQHSCIALWSGDNECDSMCRWVRSAFKGEETQRMDPNRNKITREVLKDVVYWEDNTRPYLPSSPYVDQVAYETKLPMAEDHLWGPRDYFKGDFYNKNSVCHFASETGYHGCPAPQTLRKFIPESELNDHGDKEKCTNAAWIVHAANPGTSLNEPYAYRIPLMSRQIDRLFGFNGDESIDDYALMSQISQAEAVKFFIEHFRIQKWYRTGIIWWNIIDGWPQISDAVVDWYGTKKLAYSYIMRSQKPLCLFFDEPDENGNITLCASNDLRQTKNISYKVTDMKTGKVVLEGNSDITNDTTVRLGTVKEEHTYYFIEWSGDVKGNNHFVGAIGDKVDYAEYVDFMKKADYFNALEGFDFSAVCNGKEN